MPTPTPAAPSWPAAICNWATAAPWRAAHSRPSARRYVPTVGLLLPNALSLPTGTLTVNNAGQGFSVNFAGRFTLTGSNTLAGSNTGLVTFTGPISGSGALNVTALTAQLQGNNSYTGGTTLTSGTLLVQPVNATQTLTFAGATGGTFTLAFNNQLTAPITYSATGTTLRTNIAAALAALPSVGGAGNISVVSNAGGTQVTVAFLNNTGGPTMTAYAAGLTGTTERSVSRRRRRAASAPSARGRSFLPAARCWPIRPPRSPIRWS